ncbi:hypothetical protein ES705_44312 [subsurface metagenome]
MFIRELRSGNWRRVEAAAKALGEMGDPMALQPLNEVLYSQMGRTIAEVYNATSRAIAVIERKQRGFDWLKVDKEHPWDQVQIVSHHLNELVRDEEERKAAIAWHYYLLSS